MRSNPELIAPDVVLAGAVAVYKNAIPNWKDIIDLAEKESIWAPAVAKKTSEHEGEASSSEPQVRVVDGTIVPEIYRNYVEEILMKYLKSYRLQFNCRYVETILGLDKLPLLLRYYPGGYFKAHVDFGPSNGRIVSAVFYLNDNYSGGELEFTRFNSKIKPEAGTLVLFPSNYAYEHVAHEVLDGTKYAITVWMK